MVTGQHKLRTLFKYQNEQQRKAERLRNKSENAELARENANNDSLQQNEEFEQQIIVQSNMIFFHYVSHLFLLHILDIVYVISLF